MSMFVHLSPLSCRRVSPHRRNTSFEPTCLRASKPATGLLVARTFSFRMSWTPRSWQDMCEPQRSFTSLSLRAMCPLETTAGQTVSAKSNISAYDRQRLNLSAFYSRVESEVASSFREALSQASAGAVPFMKVPSALRSAERNVMGPAWPSRASRASLVASALDDVAAESWLCFQQRRQVRKNFGLNPAQPVAQDPVPSKLQTCFSHRRTSAGEEHDGSYSCRRRERQAADGRGTRCSTFSTAHSQVVVGPRAKAGLKLRSCSGCSVCLLPC